MEASLGDDVNFDGRVTTRIVDTTRVYFSDCHDGSGSDVSCFDSAAARLLTDPIVVKRLLFPFAG